MSTPSEGMSPAAQQWLMSGPALSKVFEDLSEQIAATGVLPMSYIRNLFGDVGTALAPLVRAQHPEAVKAAIAVFGASDAITEGVGLWLHANWEEPHLPSAIAAEDAYVLFIGAITQLDELAAALDAVHPD